MKRKKESYRRVLIRGTKWEFKKKEILSYF
jgi:hypothetical protein